MLHIIHEFGGVEEPERQKACYDMGLLSVLRKTAFRTAGNHRTDDTFRYGRCSGSSGGYEVFEDVEKVAKRNAEKSGGSFTKTNDMAKHSKTPISHIRRAGLRSLQWKNVRNCTETVTSTALQLWRKNFSLRMQNTKTGLVQKSS